MANLFAFVLSARKEGGQRLGKGTCSIFGAKHLGNQFDLQATITLDNDCPCEAASKRDLSSTE